MKFKSVGTTFLLFIFTRLLASSSSFTLNDGFFLEEQSNPKPDLKAAYCNITVSSYSGAIVVSNPGDCSTYASCDWIIYAQGNAGNTYRGVMVAFSNAQMHWADCVHVFTTNTSVVDSSAPYVSYCGYQSSGTTNINGLYWSQLYVAFRACGDWCYPGFKLLYTSDTACLQPRLLTAADTSFSSPFYPETYTRYLQCVWYIDVPVNEMMMLSFDHFNVGGPTTDPCDGVYGRFNITGDRVADLTYCNSHPPPSYLYLLGTGRYVFRLDTGNLIPSAGQGFSASYQIIDQSATTPDSGLELSPPASNPDKRNRMEQKLSTKNVGGLTHYYVPMDELKVVERPNYDDERRRELSALCNGETPIIVSNSSGVVTSPDYPATYPEGLDCSWRILPHQSHISSVYTGVFIAFNVFNLHWSDCVHISEYSSTAPTLTNTQAFCGNFRSMPVTAYVESDAYVSFKSCSGFSYPGFRLYYTYDKACYTSQVLPQPSGTIQSPFYPEAPIQLLNCQWTMTIPVRQMMVLTFNEFNLAGPLTGACNPNYGSIVITASNRQPITYCSSNRPTAELYLTGSMTFRYQAGSMTPPSTERFFASYRVDLENTILCGSGVRLVGGSASYLGRLEILYNGQWGTVCDQGFTDTQAAVACYSLGYGYAGSFLGNQFGAGTGPIWLSNVQCTGRETCLGRCSHSNWGNTTCNHNNDVSITCRLNRCTASGDPHYTSFDSMYMSYRGTCKYLLAKPARPDVSLHDFEVFARNYNGGTSSSWVNYVEVVYGADTVRLRLSGTGTQAIALVNGVQVQIPYTSLDTVYIIVYSGSFVRFETTFGLRVEFSNAYYNVYVPVAYFADMFGICGNNDGNAQNDWIIANGTNVYGHPNRVNLLGDSFVVDYDPEDPYRTCQYGLPAPPPCTPVPPAYSSRCALMTNTAGVFGQCIIAIGTDAAQTAYNNCVQDACNTNGASICDSLQSYVDQCRENEVVVSCDVWQPASSCGAVTCPSGMIYRCSTTACLATCTNPNAPDDCSQPDRPACVCPDGQILHNGVCVTTCPIGCIDENSQFRAIGEQWPSSFNCSTLTCTYCPSCPLSGRIDWQAGCRPFETCYGNVCLVPTTPTTPTTTTMPTTTEPGAGVPTLTNRPYISVQLNGSLILSNALTFECQDGYNSEFTSSFANAVGRLNQMISQGSLCSNGLVVMPGQSQLTQQGTEGRVSMTMMVGVSPPNFVTIGNVEICYKQSAAFIQNFGNWRQPILPPIFNCPTSDFNPTTFDYRQASWKTPF